MSGYDSFTRYVNSITGWPQSQPNYLAPAGSNDWLNLGTGLSFGKNAANLGRMGANAFGANELGSGMQGAGGLFGLASGANNLAEGNYVGGAGDIVRGAGSLAQGAEGLGLTNFGPALSGGLGAAAGLAGMGMGGYQLGQGDMTGIASLYGGALGTTAGLGTMAAGGALGSTMAAAAPAMVAAANPVTLGLGAFLAIGLMNRQAKEQERIENQTKESVRIRQGANDAMAKLARTGGLANTLEGMESFTPEQQGPALQQALDAFRTGMDAAPVGQQMLATRGQGGSASLTKPLSDPQLHEYRMKYFPALRDSQIGFMRTADSAAQRGDDLPGWATESFGTYDPAALLNSMSIGDLGNQPGSFNPYWDINYSQAVPGTLGSFVPETLAAHDPTFAGGALDRRFQDIPALDMFGQAPLTPEQIDTASTARQAAAENIFNINTGQDPNVDRYGVYHDPSGSSWQTDPKSIAYAAPYLEGGSQHLADYYGLSPETVQALKDGQTDWQMAIGTMQAEQAALPNALRHPAYRIAVADANTGGG